MTSKEWEKYFENGARSNRILSHEDPPGRKTFIRINIDEALNAMRNDLDDICLVLENFEVQGSDALSDNPRKLITGGFWVIKPVAQGDYDAETEALEECEAVIEQMIAKFRNDAKKTKASSAHPHRIQAVGLNTRMNKVTNVFGNWHGYRCEVVFNQTFRNNLVLKNEEWKDDTVYGF